MTCAACGCGDHRYGTTDPHHQPDRMACINQLRAESERLATALSTTADVLYDLWRCNADDERRSLASKVGFVVANYSVHPSKLVGFTLPQWPRPADEVSVFTPLCGTPHLTDEGDAYSCCRPAGHDGAHQDGVFQWLFPEREFG